MRDAESHPVAERARWPVGLPEAPHERLLLFRAVGGRRLTLASNYPYELWADGEFVGDGGLRCAPGEALLDRWDASAAAEVVVRLHYMAPRHVPVYARCLFDDPFFADLDDADADADAGGGRGGRVHWACHEDVSIGFAAKACAQLPAQNVVRGPPAPGRPLPLGPAALTADWVAVDAGLKPARWVEVDVRPGPPTAVAGDDGGPWDPAAAADVLEHARSAAGVVCRTVDLGRIALHRFEVSADRAVALCYAETPDFRTAWDTRSRGKVHLADAVAVGAAGAAPYGTRGCRYVHVVAPPDARVTIRAWRREYPLTWTGAGAGTEVTPATAAVPTAAAPTADPELAAILQACRNNLVACVDGGVVDTCWRERAQWVGDLRMSALALRALADDPEVVRLALRQVASSYDPATLMVQGAWPVRDPGYRGLLIPPFHLAYCLTVLEQTPDDAGLVGLARESLTGWRRTYLRDGLLRDLPGWHFVDWDATDPTPEGRAADRSTRPMAGAHAVVNAWYHEACVGLGLPSIDLAAFDRTFWNPAAGAYRLVEAETTDDASAGRTVPAVPAAVASPHATAAAVVSLGTSRGRAYLASDPWLDRVTPYFGYFVARALGRLGRPAMLDYVKRRYLPSARASGTIYERTDNRWSLAHGWSVGVAELIVPYAGPPDARPAPPHRV